MKFIAVLITVEDINRSRQFYENIMKQTVEFDFGQNVSFKGGFAIHLKSHYASLIDNKLIQFGSNCHELYFEFDNIDELVDVLKLNNVQFVHEAREQPWRQKVVRFYDPDLHIIEVGESFEFLSYRLSCDGLSVQDIAKATMMPEDFITACIDRFKS